MTAATTTTATATNMSFQILLPTLAEAYARPTKNDWEALRPFICESYRNQSTVRQIREILLANGYGVSERMLKGRLAKWDMANKNNTFKPHHVRAIVRKGQECLRQGKQPPVFCIRGRKRTYDEALRIHCRWKGSESPKSEDSLDERPSTPVDLIELPREEEGEDESHKRIMTFASSPEIPRVPCISPNEEHEVRTFSSIKTWYDEYGPTLLEKEQWHHCCPIYFLLENCQTAIQSAQTYGSTSDWDALRALDVKAQDSVSRLSTSSFLNALRWLTLFDTADRSEGSVSHVVMDMLSRIAIAQLGPNHPIALLFGAAASAQISRDLVVKLWSLTRAAVVARTAGAQYNDFLGHSLVRMGAIMANLEEYALAEQFLDEAEQLGVRTAEVKVLGCCRWMTGRTKRLQGQHVEAIRGLEDHAAFLRENDLDGTFLGLSVQEELGKSNGALERWEQAADSYREAIRFHEVNRMTNPSRKGNLIHSLDDALSRLGKKAESVLLQEQYPEAFRID